MLELFDKSSQPKIRRTDESVIYNFIDKEEREAMVKEDKGKAFKYGEHYENDAKFYDYFEAYPDGASRHENRRLHESILSNLKNKNQEKVLDVGCGNAWVAKHFLARQSEVFSMDISSVNVEKALSTYPNPKHTGVIADVFNLPFRQDQFDVIIAAEIIEHVVDPSGFVKALFGVLKPGGTLVVSTPFEEKIKYSMCIHCNQATPQFAHLHSFSKQSFIDILEKNFHKDAIGKANIYSFSNKALTKLRTHVLLKFFPFGFWKILDKLSNAILSKPTRLILSLEKAS